MLRILAILALHAVARAADPAILGTWVFAEIVDPIADGAGLVIETGRLEETSIRFSSDGYDFLRKDTTVLHMVFKIIATDPRSTAVELIPDYTLLDQPQFAGKPTAQAAMRRNLDAMRRQVTIETMPGSIVFKDLIGRRVRYTSKPAP